MVTAQQVPTIVNGVNVDNLFTTIDAIKSSPAIAKFKFRIQNRWEGAGQNRSAVNEFYGSRTGVFATEFFCSACR